MNLSEELQTHCEDEGDCEGVDLNRRVHLHSQLFNQALFGQGHSALGRQILLIYCRNFPAGWGLGNKEFVEDSKKPWTSVYKGSHGQYGLRQINSSSSPAFSEPETQALHEQVTKVKLPVHKMVPG